MSDSLWPHGLQHPRPPCPSPTPRVHPNPCPSKRWCHPMISSSVIPFSSCPQSFPASGSFPMSQLFASGGQSIGVSASTSNEHPGLISFRMDWLDLLAFVTVALIWVKNSQTLGNRSYHDKHHRLKQGWLLSGSWAATLPAHCPGQNPKSTRNAFSHWAWEKL